MAILFNPGSIELPDSICNYGRNITRMSMLTWIKPDLEVDCRLFSASTGDSTVNSRVNFSLEEQAGNYVLRISGRVLDSDTWRFANCAGNPLVAAAWQHVAIIIRYDLEEGGGYVDGVDVGDFATDGPWSTPPTSDTANLRATIGAEEDGVAPRYDGDMEDLIIYHRELSEKEIINAFRSYHKVIPMDYVSRHPMTEGHAGLTVSGAGKVRDLGENQWNGTSINSPVYSGSEGAYSIKRAI